MAEHSGFFDSINIGTEQNPEWDISYLAFEFARYFALFVSNGVFISEYSELAVSALQGYSLNLSKGFAFINGYYYYNDSNLIVEIEETDGVNNRIDRVVLRWSSSDRRIRKEVVKGIPSLTPSPPSLVRDGNVYELSLARVLVEKTTISITPELITDERLDNSVCGIVRSILDVPDTDPFFSQLEQMTVHLQEVIDGIIAGSEVMLKEQYVDPENDDSVLLATNASIHINDNNNPHKVTKSQVGLGNVANVAALPLSGGTVTGVTSFNAGLTASGSVGLGRGPGYYGLSKSSFKTYLCTNVPFAVLNTQADGEMPIECSHLDSFDGNQSWRFGGYNASVNSLFSNGISTVLATAFAFRIMNRAASTYMPAYASAFTPASSRRFKTNIKDLTLEKAKKLLKFRAVEYNRVEQDEKGENIEGNKAYGFIAEEVEEIDDTYVAYLDGKPEALDYMEMMAPFKLLVQDLYSEIDELKNRILSLEKEREV